ncbi:MAG: CPXCG motif-containing cysteine-rich protein [Woeseiaceae bacterium]
MNELSEESVGCPYCGETITVLVDHSVDEQEYVEDCHVCCRPIVVNVFIDNAGEAAVGVRCENE